MIHDFHFDPETVRFVSCLRGAPGRAGAILHYWSIYPIHLPANKLVGQRILLRKEVIQPLVPQRLPCYDFIPVISHTFGAFPLLTGWINDFGCNQLP